MLRLLVVIGFVTLVATHARADEPQPAAGEIRADVVVYGGTPAGVMAAVAAARQGHSVALIDINGHVGGVVSGGLVASDMGDRATIGGLAQDFFQRIVKYYTAKYGADSKELKACRNGATFEPHVAELIFDQLLAEQHVKVWKRHRYRSVTLDGNRSVPGRRVASLVVDEVANRTTRTFTGAMFIDASYEGDLMAGAHVPYRVGREGRAEYGEQLAGVSMGPREQRGMGDHRTQAYNYRVTVTSNTANRVLFPKPEHYDPSPFVATDGARIKAGRATGFGSFFTTIDKAHPNLKYDANWFDWAGNSEGYADGDWETRDRIAARIRDRALSRLYYFQNDPELPEAFRTAARTWGLPQDEFADNGHFPFQLYVREARRMVGQYVLREQDLTQDRWKADGIATGSYGIDCHVVQQLRDDAGRLVPEHTRHVACNNYDIPYRSLVPPDGENLLVPVCCSATHVAYCSLRMEPVYMMLGQAAGDAAHLALATKTTVQKVDPQQLRELLLKEGAVLDAGYQPQVKLFWTPTHPKPGEKVVFKAIAGTLKDPLTKIDWDFAGTGQVAATGERVVQAFDLDKTYSVSLLVTDAAGRRRLVTAEVPVGTAAARDVTLDDMDAELSGRWNGTIPDYLLTKPLRYSDVFTGPGIHRDVVRLGQVAPARARFQPTIPQTGRYQLCLGFRPAKSQATNVPLTVRHAEGTAKLTVDQRTERPPFNFVSVGEFKFNAGSGGFVDIANADTDGRVAIDGLRWVWLGD
jgi:hypothetical protein